MRWMFVVLVLFLILLGVNDSVRRGSFSPNVGVGDIVYYEMNYWDKKEPEIPGCVEEYNLFEDLIGSDRFSPLCMNSGGHIKTFPDECLNEYELNEVYSVDINKGKKDNLKTNSCNNNIRSENVDCKLWCKLLTEKKKVIPTQSNNYANEVLVLKYEDGECEVLEKQCSSSGDYYGYKDLSSARCKCIPFSDGEIHPFIIGNSQEI